MRLGLQLVQWIAATAFLALTAASCSAAAPVEPIVETAAAEVTEVADASVEEAPVEVEEPPPGRVALANAEGQAHVLWFWGAH